jgi:hypothetical protein
MSTRIMGFKPPDQTWQRMKAVWDACEVAGVAIPAKVAEYFNHQTPDPRGVEVDLARSLAVTKYITEGMDGYEVDLTKLPADTTVLRFFNSW